MSAGTKVVWPASKRDRRVGRLRFRRGSQYPPTWPRTIATVVSCEERSCQAFPGSGYCTMLRTVIPFQLRVWLSIFPILCGERNSNGCDWLISPSIATVQTEHLDEPFEVVDTDKE